MRKCGECQACCVTFKVPELNKAEGVPCKNLCEAGCGIHKTRPNVCRVYQCMWLQGVMGQKDQPNLSGVIFSLSPDRNALLQRTGIRLIVAMEAWPESFETDSAKALIAKVARNNLVAMKVSNKRVLVGPEKMIEMAYPVLEELTTTESQT